MIGRWSPLGSRTHARAFYRHCLGQINLWDTKVKEADVRALVDVTRRRPKPAEYTISGYEPGVTHDSDAMWGT